MIRFRVVKEIIFVVVFDDFFFIYKNNLICYFVSEVYFVGDYYYGYIF